MNLRYLFDNKNPFCSFDDGIRSHKMSLSGETCEGLLIKGGATRTIRIRGGSRAPHFVAGADDIGWRAVPIGEGGRSITVSLVAGSDRASATTVASRGAPVTVWTPALLDLPDPFVVADLLVEITDHPEDLFLGTARRVRRDPLYALARGVGVEIGPGSNPQIVQSDDTTVLYIEEKTAEEWRALYVDTDTTRVWSEARYTIGSAHALPVDDASLDFVFSSHVLEHLYNPLGHLAHWRAKLKPGGVVLAVAPCADGTKDFVMPQTNIADLIAEFEAGTFVCPYSTYEKWASCYYDDLEAVRLKAKQMFESQFSIHVHVYDYMTVNAMLNFALSKLGYTGFRVKYTKNAKDFILVLKA
jgi:SAM-dependent methyltransferase